MDNRLLLSQHKPPYHGFFLADSRYPLNVRWPAAEELARLASFPLCEQQAVKEHTGTDFGKIHEVNTNRWTKAIGNSIAVIDQIATVGTMLQLSGIRFAKPIEVVIMDYAARVRGHSLNNGPLNGLGVVDEVSQIVPSGSEGDGVDTSWFPITPTQPCSQQMAVSQG